MTFTLLTAFTAIHYLMQSPKPVRRNKPSIVLSYLKEVAPFFVTLCILSIVSRTLRHFFAGASDLLPVAMLLGAFVLLRIFKRPESLSGILFAIWAYLETQMPLDALFKATVICLGLPIIEAAVDGVRFRLALSPTPKNFASLPGRLALLALVLLVLSGFFAFSR